MSDFELYGDYNDVEDEKEPRGRHPILRMLRWFILATLFLFVGFLLFRLIVAEYYPRDLKKFYMTDALTAYAETNELDVEKVKISVPYDDNVSASFIADNLLVERGAGAVQFTLRMSRFTMEKWAETKGVDWDGKTIDETVFTVTLLDDLGNRYPVSCSFAKRYLWYRSVKYCFDGVDLSDSVSWVRVDVFLSGADQDADPYASIPILDFSGRNASE